MAELKPCPFCGGNVQRLTRLPFYQLPRFKGRRGVVCVNCGCFVLGNSEETAEELWNTRANEKGGSE